MTDTLPQLAPAEHADLERLVGHSLTNEEALVLLHERWAEDKRGTRLVKEWLEEKHGAMSR